VTEAKPATAARIYDVFLGGTHNYPADREAAAQALAIYPSVAAIARSNRAYLQRAVRYVAGDGVRQFLDVGSGIPTQGNVHEVVDETIDGGRVAYVDIDPVAVAESQDLLEGNGHATAIWGNLHEPQAILDNPQVRAVIDFDQPVGLLLTAVLHLVSGEVHEPVATLVGALAPGSYLVVSHGVYDEQNELVAKGDDLAEVYRQRTTSAVSVRPRSEIERFFTGLELVEPGLTWISAWRPDPARPDEHTDKPHETGILGGVGRKP
jgi:hypothetical protein